MTDPPSAAGPDRGVDSGRRPIYSIGAVAGMLGIETATLRAWEDRYSVVVPTRSAGAQRVYSRDDVERLRFIVDTIEGGATAGEAHRLLDERMRGGGAPPAVEAPATTILVLLAERDRYAAELCEYFLRTEGYGVCLAFESVAAERLFVEQTPDVVVVELMISGGGLDLCRRLADGAVPVLAVSALNLADDALAAGASAYLAKPFEPLQFVSTVRDLLGSSALTRRVRGYVS